MITNQSSELHGTVLTSDRLDDDELDLFTVFQIIWGGKWMVISFTVAAAIATVIAVLYIENEYRASALLAPNQSESGFKAGGALAQFGAIASMAGIDLGGGSVNPTTVAIESLQSHDFLSGFINKHDLKPALFAAKKWLPASKSWEFDRSIFDEGTGVWTRVVSPPRQQTPSDWESVDEFKKLLTVSEDKKTSLVTVGITIRSPDLAKAWTDWLIQDINEYLRHRDASDAKKSIEYLERQLTQTTVSEMQKVFYQLIEQQTKTVMLTEVREYYAFKVIESPVVPERKVKPLRAVIVILSTFMAMLLSSAVLLLFRSRKLVR